jgi:hypothetical protein
MTNTTPSSDLRKELLHGTLPLPVVVLLIEKSTVESCHRVLE